MAGKPKSHLTLSRSTKLPVSEDFESKPNTLVVHSMSSQLRLSLGVDEEEEGFAYVMIHSVFDSYLSKFPMIGPMNSAKNPCGEPMVSPDGDVNVQ